MGFKCGIVGLPNVGKSTLFNALTESNKAEAANYPFATIEPNIGRVPVNDARLEKLSVISKSIKNIPNYIDFVDIAGLVKGASKGEGLGNQFLAHIREMDAIAHVVRCFYDENITHQSTSLDPIKDIEIVETELKLADLEILKKKSDNLKKKNKAGNKKTKVQLNIIEILIEKLNNFENLNFNNFSNEEIEIVKKLNLITIKPMLYICNIDEKSILSGNILSDYVLKKGKENNAKCVLVSAAIESQIAQFNNKKDKIEFLKELKLEETTLKKVINSGYNLLNLVTFFTSGPKETRAWTIKRNSKVTKAAGKIHSDFEKGFIRAETISYNDFIKYNGENGCKEAGKLRQEGKDYIVQDGDIYNFLFNV